MQAESIASAGHYLGLALSHDYPKHVLATDADGPPIAMLKVVDALLVKAIEDAGYQWEYIAVHDPKCFDYYDYKKPTGAFSTRLTVSDSVYTWDDGCYGDEYSDPYGAYRSKKIIWVAPPREYPVDSTYVSYGNQVSSPVPAVR